MPTVNLGLTPWQNAKLYAFKTTIVLAFPFQLTGPLTPNHGAICAIIITKQTTSTTILINGQVMHVLINDISGQALYDVLSMYCINFKILHASIY